MRGVLEKGAIRNRYVLEIGSRPPSGITGFETRIDHRNTRTTRLDARFKPFRRLLPLRLHIAHGVLVDIGVFNRDLVVLEIRLDGGRFAHGGFGLSDIRHRHTVQSQPSRSTGRHEPEPHAELAHIRRDGDCGGHVLPSTGAVVVQQVACHHIIGDDAGREVGILDDVGIHIHPPRDLHLHTRICGNIPFVDEFQRLTSRGAAPADEICFSFRTHRS